MAGISLMFFQMGISSKVSAKAFPQTICSFSAPQKTP